MASLQRNFRQLRVEQNLSLQQVASLVGIDATYLSKIERGITKPSSSVVLKIESILGYKTFENIAEQNGSSYISNGIDPRNKLNNLNGKEWIQETKTVWNQKGLGANHEQTKYEKMHPAPFSYQDIARLIRFFTKPGMLILDPFCGVGSTLKAAAIEGRSGLGVELIEKWAEIAKLRLAEEVPDASKQQVWCMDTRDALDLVSDETVDFIVTSPPYWGILNKKADHKTTRVRLNNGLSKNYSDSERDLANIPDYDDFLVQLSALINSWGSKLKRGSYFALIVSDFKHGDKYYSFHSDIYQRLSESELILQGIVILNQNHKGLYPYGYPYAFVPNIHHQYILLFRRFDPKKKKNQTDKRILNPNVSKARIPVDLHSAIQQLRKLPYTKGNMASRHWGHLRHSICSFPSKMKPALASTLVSLFSNSDSVVLDPFSGSGTISFEASLQGRRSIASDLSPLAFVISRAKINPPRQDEVTALIKDLSAYIKKVGGTIAVADMELEIKSFFHGKTAREIMASRRYLRKKTNNFTEGDAALFVTACLAHILHGNRPYALSRRSHNIIPIPPKGPFEYKSVVDSLNDKAKRMMEAPLPETFLPGRVFQESASAIPLQDECIDSIITSPPFFGTTEFLRQNRIRNWLVGWNYKTQEENKEFFLEHFKGVDGYPPIIKELMRLLKSGGVLVFHVGIVKERNMAEMLLPVMTGNGLKYIDEVWEDTSSLESHGRTDRGGTHKHGFIVYQKP